MKDIAVEMAHCAWCGPKPKTEFFKARGRKHGVAAFCKPCDNKYKKEWEHRTGRSKPKVDRPPIADGKAWCLYNNHGYIDLSNFYTYTRRGRLTVFSYCNDCSNEKSRKYKIKRSLHNRGLYKKEFTVKKSLCECGKPKNKDDEACPECMVLDGTRTVEAGIIGILRLLGGRATTDEIASAIGKSHRQVLRICQDLTKSVVRQVGEDIEVKQQFIFQRLERVEEELGSAVYWKLVISSRR